MLTTGLMRGGADQGAESGIKGQRRDLPSSTFLFARRNLPTTQLTAY